MLVVIDLQVRLTPAIDENASLVANARRLLDVAALFDVPVSVHGAEPERPRSDGPELAPDPSNCP